MHLSQVYQQEKYNSLYVMYKSHFLFLPYSLNVKVIFADGIEAVIIVNITCVLHLYTNNKSVFVVCVTSNHSLLHYYCIGIFVILFLYYYDHYLHYILLLILIIIVIINIIIIIMNS